MTAKKDRVMRLPEDAEDVVLLTNKTGTRGVVGRNIVAGAEREGVVWVVPGTSAKMMSRAEFMRRLEEFAERMPGVMEKLRARNVVCARRDGLQGKLVNGPRSRLRQQLSGDDQ
jgi:hypothetical protein